MGTTLGHCLLRSVTVSSVADLQTAFNRAQSGDEFILANGTYINNTLMGTTSNITMLELAVTRMR